MKPLSGGDIPAKVKQPNDIKLITQPKQQILKGSNKHTLIPLLRIRLAADRLRLVPFPSPSANA